MTITADGATADEEARRRWATLGIVLIVQFMVILDATIVSVALPSIQSGLHFGSQLDLQWVVNAYALFFGGFLLLGGRAGDIFGHRRLFLAGVVLFTLASLFNGLAQSSGMLIGGRVAQGLGAAMVSPAVLSIILVAFTDHRERTKAMGYFTSVSASGGGVGILLGGVLTDTLSWRAIFLVNVPIGVIAVLAAIRFIPKSGISSGGFRTLDLPGAVSITAALTVLVYTVVNAGSWGWSSSRVIGLLCASAALLVAFVAIESRTRKPLVRLGIFSSRTLRVGNITMFLMMAGVYTLLFFPVLYLSEVKGYSPLKTGLAILPWPVMMVVAGAVCQYMIKTVGVRIPLVTGLVLVAGGLFAFGHLSPSESYAAGVLPGVLLTAAGAGLAWQLLFLVATAKVPQEESGLASGLVNSSQQIGAAIGLAALAAVAAARTSHILGQVGGKPSASQTATALTLGFERGFFVAGVVVAIAAIVALLGVRASDIEHSPDAVDAAVAAETGLAAEGAAGELAVAAAEDSDTAAIRNS
jgi:EmrB/QacA subfamily drug resistance transporter